MLVLKILGIIVLLIALIMLIPVGADVSYIGGELKVSAKLNGFLLQLFPKNDTEPKKEKKPKKEKIKKKKKKADNTEQPKKKKKLELNFSLDEITGLLKTVFRGLGRFGRKIKVSRFLLHFTAGGKDPANTANLFGKVNAILNSLAPICSKRFDVQDLDVWTDVDFLSEKIELDFALVVTIRIGQVFGALLSILFGALAILVKNKLRLRKEKKLAAAELRAADNKNDKTDNTHVDERTENNGQ